MVKEDAFVDTSAIVKRYHAEIGSAWIKQLCKRRDVKISVSSLTLLEFKSAFAGKVRTGQVSRSTFRRVLRRLATDITDGKYNVVSVSRNYWALAGELLKKHGPLRSLRTLDALQLAVALHTKMRQGIDQFVTADKNLLSCAALEGLAPLNPELTPST